MRLDQYSRWVDPAPLEVERSRLPWWTLLLCKLLLAASPIILVAVVVVVFVARRMWCYPVCEIGAVILAGLGVGYSWWAPVKLLHGQCAATYAMHAEGVGQLLRRPVLHLWRSPAQALIWRA